MDKKLLFILSSSILTLVLLVFFVVTGWDYFTHRYEGKEVSAPSIEAKIEIDLSSQKRDFPAELIGSWGSAKDAGNYMVDVGIINDWTSTPIYVKNFNGDLTSESNYDFSATDAKIKKALDDGFKIQLSVADVNNLPSDLSKYETAVKHLMKHMTQGWANGFRLTSNDIRLVLYANEPDMKPPKGGEAPFWKGTDDDFLKAYATFAKAVKSVDNNLPVGGPCFAFPVAFSEKTGEEVKVLSHVTKFLDYTKANNIPVDYFSWHFYGAVPYSAYKRSDAITNLLDKYPSLSPLYSTPRSANDEWDMLLGIGGAFTNDLANAWGAAGRLSNLIAMINGGLDSSTLATGIGQGGTGPSGPGGASETYFLLGGVTNFRPSYYMLKALSYLKNSNKLLLSGIDKKGFGALAVINNAEDNLVILISNYDVWRYADHSNKNKPSNTTAPGFTGSSLEAEASRFSSKPSDLATSEIYTSFNIGVNNAKNWNSKNVTYKRYVVDDSNKLSEAGSGSLSVDNGKLNVSANISMPQIQLIIISAK